MTETGPVAVLLRRPRIIGWRRNGCPIWSVAGGSENATENTGGDDSGENTDAGGGGEDQSDEQEEPDESEDQKDERESPAKTRADKEYRERTRRRAAEQERDRLKAQLEEIEDRDKSDLERATKRASKAEERVQVLEPTVKRQAIEIAFLKASNGDARRRPISWVDADDVLTLVAKELSGITVGDDGEIDMDEVRSVVDDIAKRKSHLVRKAQAPATASGGNVGAGNDQPKERSKEDLARTYGALRTRV